MRSYFALSILVIITIGSFFRIYRLEIADSAHDYQVLRLHVRSLPILDPRKVSFTNSASSLVLPMIYNGLTRMGSDGLPHLCLASSVNVERGGVVYLFKIKRTFWCDGTPVCSKDFAESWRSALSPHFPSPSSSLLFCIRNAEKIKRGEADPKMLGVYTPNEEELLIELEHAIPQNYFFELLSKPPFFAAGSYKDGFQHLYNGPYVPDFWNQPNLISLSEIKFDLQRNPCYSELPFFKKVTFYVIDDEQLPLYLFTRNQLDWIGAPTLSLSSEFLFFEPLKIHERVTSKHPISTIWLVCNTKSKIFKDRSVRQMLYHLIDRELLSSKMGSDYKPAYTIFPPEISELANVPFSHSLEQISIPLTKTKWSFLFPKRWASELITGVLGSEISKKLNVALELKMQDDWPMFLSCFMGKKFDICLYRWIWMMRNPADFFSEFFAQECNYSQWDFQAWSEQHENMENKHQINSWIDMEKNLLENLPVIPLVFEPFRAIKHKELQGFVVLPGGHVDFSRCTKFVPEKIIED